MYIAYCTSFICSKMSAINLADSPTALERARSERLAIPAAFQAALLPGHISVHALINYSNLPGPIAMQSQGYGLEDWLSTNSPDSHFFPGLLPQMPLPPENIVKALSSALEGSVVEGLKSVLAHHLITHPGPHPAHPNHHPISTNLPLWVVTYWIEAYQARADRQVWKTAMEWMDRRAHGIREGREAQAQVTKLFSQIHWSDDLQGYNLNFGTGNGIGSLAAFLGEHQITGAQICQLLALVRNQLYKDSRSLTHTIVDLDFIETLVNITSSDSPPERLPRFHQDTENDILSGHSKVIAGVVHINNNHYTFFVLNIEETYLGYADSFGNTMPPKIRRAFIWWLTRLTQLLEKKTGQEFPAPELWFRQLPISKQRADDTTSCGFLAVNGLMHHLFPLNVQLVESRIRNIAAYRMSAFADICRLHLDSVSMMCIFEYE